MRILLATGVQGLEDELRNRELADVTIVSSRSHAETEAVIGDSQVVIGDPDMLAPHVAHAPGLDWVQCTWAGVEGFFDLSDRRDYRLTRVASVYGPMVAEYVMMQMLARERHLVKLARQQGVRTWQAAPYRRLSDLTLGLLGLGDIGRAVARAAAALGMQVWGLRTKDTPVDGVNKVFPASQVEQFVSGVDYLVNTLPSTPSTRGMLTGDLLRRCKRTAVFINVGRADIVAEETLVDVIAEGHLAGAILDVFEREPLPGDSRLWELPGVTITPHVAAKGFPVDIADIFEDNLERYRAGEPLKYQVDWGRGY